MCNGTCWNWYELVDEWMDVCNSINKLDAVVDVSIWMMVTNVGMVWSSDVDDGMLQTNYSKCVLHLNTTCYDLNYSIQMTKETLPVVYRELQN